MMYQGSDKHLAGWDLSPMQLMKEKQMLTIHL